MPPGRRDAMDLGRLIRERVRAALADGGGTNVAAAVNINRPGRTTAVCSDADVTVIQRDGETEVIRHDEESEER
jgi:hypothetical protein